MGLKDVSKPILWVTRFMNDAAGGDWKLGLAPQYRIDEQGHVEKKTGLPLLAANLMDWNPSKLEHAFVYYAGGRGELYTQTAKLVNAIVTGDEIKPNYIPVASRFNVSKGGGDAVAEYYNIKDDMETNKKVRAIVSKNKGTETLELLKTDDAMNDVLIQYNIAERKIKQYNEMINKEGQSKELIDKYTQKRKDIM